MAGPIPNARFLRMDSLKAAARRVGLSLATGYILLYFGEIVFWATPEREGMDLPGLAATWLVYSLFAHVFLLVAGGFRVRGPYAVFLAGAAFGWFEEGLVLQTTYGSADTPFPQSISFTALAWHALIDVWIGWYLLRASLAGGRPGRTTAVAAAVGAFYGLWAIFWWTEPPEPMRLLLEGRHEVALTGRFAAYGFITTGLLIGAYHVHARLADAGAAGTRVERWFFGLAGLAYFVGITVPAAPRAAWLLPILMGLTLFALNRNRRRERRVDAVEAFPISRGLRHSLLLFAIPAVASAVYLVALAWGVRVRTNLWVYHITTWLGAVAWVVSLGVVLGRGRIQGIRGPARNGESHCGNGCPGPGGR